MQLNGVFSSSGVGAIVEDLLRIVHGAGRVSVRLNGVVPVAE